MKIQLTESKLKAIVAESIKRYLMENMENESIVIANNVPTQIRDKYLQKMIKENPKLDPKGFFYVGNSLKHNGKSAPKLMANPKISKPEGMSDEEYEKTIVEPNNPTFKAELEKYPDEEFRPINNNMGRYFGGEADYSKSYEISNYGRIRILDYKDATKSRIVSGYEAPTSKAMQFNLGGGQHTCPPVHSFVADAFLEPKDPHEWEIKHKDGDWKNNKVDNLEWVPRKFRRNKLSVKLK